MWISAIYYGANAYPVPHVRKWRKGRDMDLYAAGHQIEPKGLEYDSMEIIR